MTDREDINRMDISITWTNGDSVKLQVDKHAPIDPGRVRRFRVMPDGYVSELDSEDNWLPVRDKGLAPLLGGSKLPCKDPACLAKVIECEYDKIRSRHGVRG